MVFLSDALSARRRVIIGFILFLTAAMIVAGLLSQWQRRIIFPGTDLPASEPRGLESIGAERWWLEHSEGRVEAWFVPAEPTDAGSPGPDRPAPAVIIAHGNGELIDSWLPQVRRYTKMGLSVLLPEYRGYGRSEGTPSEAHIKQDFLRFYDRLVVRDDVDSERIAFHGFSLGGAVLASVAKAREPSGLILQSTFTSIADMAKGIPVPGFLISDPFETLEVVEQLDIPILVIHGRADPVIPVSHGQRLARRAPNAKLIVHDGGHHMMSDTTSFWSEVRELLGRADILPDS